MHKMKSKEHIQTTEIYLDMFPEATVMLNPCIIHKIQTACCSNLSHQNHNRGK